MRPFDYLQNGLSIDFVAVGVDGQLERCKVRLSKITGFGIVHEPEFYRVGTFRRWRRWGYLRTGARTYRVALALVRAWQRSWRWELVATSYKVGWRRLGLGTAHLALDRDYRPVGFRRRGCRYPRRSWHNPPVQWTYGGLVLEKKPDEGN